MSSKSVLDIEFKFQKLMSFLASRQGCRQRLPEIIGFFNLIKSHNNPGLFQSYFLQLFPYLEDCLSRNTLIQTKPEFQERLLTELPIIEASGIGTDHPQAWQRLKNNIIQCFAESCFNLGLYNEGLNSLDINESCLSNLLKTLPGKDTLSNLQFILDELKNRSNQSHQDLQPIKQIIELWEQEQRLNHHSLPILFLDSGNSENGIFLPGVIHDLYIQTQISEKDSNHSIEINNHLFNDSQSLQLQVQDAMQAAVSFYTDIFKQQPGHTFHFIFSIIQKQYFYTGESLGLPSALLILKNLLENSEPGKTLQIQPGTLITGNIDMQGQVLQLNESVIIQKIDTAFFSHYSTLILPKSNINLAENRVRTLQQKYPKKQFTLLPVENLNDCLKLEQINIKELPKASGPIKIHQKTHLAITAIVMILFTGWWFMQDVNPVNLKMDGKVLRAFNRAGNEVWNYPFDFEPKRTNYHPEKIRDVYQKRWLTIDLDGDGKNETVVTTSEETAANSGWIYYFDYKGKLIWKYQDQSNIGYGGHTYDNFYRIHSLHSLDVDGDGKLELATISHHHLWFPAHILVYSRSGEIIGDYRHSGHINDSRAADLNNDGKDELILTGTNNDYNQAVLFVLDADNLIGHSPQDQTRYAPEGMDKGTEKYYLRLPDLKGYNIPRKRIRSHGERIRLLENNQIEVAVSTRWRKKPDKHYVFDSELKPISAVFGDGFYVDYHNLRQTYFRKEFDMEKIHKELLEVEYWDGDEWSLKPAKNHP